MTRSETHDAEATPFFVDADIKGARTLPPLAFTDPAFLERERATVFRDSWALVPPRGRDTLREDPRDLAELVRRRGAHAPVQVVDAPVVLQRDWEGTLRALPNVCTHAWHTLVDGPGRDRHLVCPQHGRRFDTTGRCVAHPGFEDAPGFPGAHDHLDALPVHEWGDLVFVALGTPRQDAADLLGPVLDSFGNVSLDRLVRRPMDGEVRTLPGNWKHHAWNYLDSFHIPHIHSRPGGLAEAVDLATYQTEIHGDAVLQWAFASDPEHGFDPDLLHKRFQRKDRHVFALWWFVFPNLTLNLYPWGLSINLYAPVPDDPSQTRFHWYHFVLDEGKYADRESIWMSSSVDDEDVDAMSQVTRGVRSGLARRGTFAPGREAGPHWFHRRVYESLVAGP